MIDIIDVTEVRPLGDYRLFVRFSDGTCGEHDFTNLIAEPSAMTAPLRDPATFARVFVELGVPTWPNGFDLDTIQLHREMEAAGELHRVAAE
jgi:Protein of unknown function (DUF2442)